MDPPRFAHRAGATVSPLAEFLQCARIARYFETKFPLKEPWPHPLQIPSKLGPPSYPSWTQLHAFPLCKMSYKME